jgi:hypothetical protein
MPDPDASGDWFEIPAGALEGKLDLRPERHIFVHCKASWYDICDPLPQLDEEQLQAVRNGT